MENLMVLRFWLIQILNCDITLKYVVILMTCVIQDGDKFKRKKHPQPFLEEALVSQNWWEAVEVV